MKTSTSPQAINELLGKSNDTLMNAKKSTGRQIPEPVVSQAPGGERAKPKLGIVSTPQPEEVLNPEEWDQGSNVTVSENINDTIGGHGETVLDNLQTWLSTYIKTAQPEDLQTLTLWIVHTHLVRETYTSARLLLDSPAPGSGKTTVLDHMSRLCFRPVQAASLSSPSLLARLLEKEPRTILIDEADRTLNPKSDGVGELLAVLNSGYRFGASRPVLVPDKEEGWKAVEMSTFGPVAMAGNAPDLPDDTRSRCIRVLLLPDHEGTVHDSDWQYIEDDARALHEQLAAWADVVREEVKTLRPEYPEDLRGRNRERWAPLYKIALAAGGQWPQNCLKLIADDLEEQKMDKEAGLQRTARHLILLQDISNVWPKSVDFMGTADLLETIKMSNPQTWGPGHQYGALTPQAMGRMLVNNFSIRAARESSGSRRRGYYRQDFMAAWGAFGMSRAG